MAIDFREKFANLKAKDVEPLSSEELVYVKIIEDYIDSQIEAKLSTDNREVWIDIVYARFTYNPISKKPFPNMTNNRRSFLTTELLKRYVEANWLIKWQLDDGMDGNMSGGDYLILLDTLIMREDITAKWARKTSENMLGERVKKQIGVCLAAIENAVKANEMACSIPIYADVLVIKELDKRGFRVKQYDNQIDGRYLTIYW